MTTTELELPQRGQLMTRDATDVGALKAECLDFFPLR
jgi:hypothetical protein